MEIKIEISPKTNDVEINLSLTPEEFKIIKSAVGWKISEMGTGDKDEELTYKMEVQLDRINLRFP